MVRRPAFESQSQSHDLGLPSRLWSSPRQGHAFRGVITWLAANAPPPSFDRGSTQSHSNALDTSANSVPGCITVEVKFKSIDAGPPSTDVSNISTMTVPKAYPLFAVRNTLDRLAPISSMCSSVDQRHGRSLQRVLFSIDRRVKLLLQQVHDALAHATAALPHTDSSKTVNNDVVGRSVMALPLSPPLPIHKQGLLAVGRVFQRARYLLP